MMNGRPHLAALRAKAKQMGLPDYGTKDMLRERIGKARSERVEAAVDAACPDVEVDEVSTQEGGA